jgi:hypothetical protein
VTAKSVTVEVFRISIMISRKVPQDKIDIMTHLLGTKRFSGRLKQVVNQVRREYPELASAIVRVSR